MVTGQSSGGVKGDWEVLLAYFMLISFLFSTFFFSCFRFAMDLVVSNLCKPKRRGIDLDH